MQRFYRILANMSAAILLVTNDNRIEFANQAFCDRFGLPETPKELVGNSAVEMLEKISLAYRHPDKAIHRIGELLERGEPLLSEEVALRDGVTILRDFVPVMIEGKLYGRLWMHYDIPTANASRTRCARAKSYSG